MRGRTHHLRRSRLGALVPAIFGVAALHRPTVACDQRQALKSENVKYPCHGGGNQLKNQSIRRKCNDTRRDQVHRN